MPLTNKPMLPQIKPVALRKFHASLARWYAANGRHDLPWRQTADPYAIWVSEVMLQQTQVATVRDTFYAPFLKRFPTIEALAAAPEQAVMKAWEGLGYYRRARHLHQAAKEVARIESRESSEEWAWFTRPNSFFHHSTLAARLSTLLSLPGIGKNTAHAILAFGFHAPVAILEANVKRVVARVFGMKTPREAELWVGAEMLLPRHDSPFTTHDSRIFFHYNQAMMDLGALICTPKAPNCKQCPLTHICKARHAPEEFPAKKAKKQSPIRRVQILVQRDSKGRLALEARDATLLGGLYGFAQVPVDAKLPKHAEIIGSVKHVYSHFTLVGQVRLVTDYPIIRSSDDPKFYTPAQIKKLPLSKLDHKVLALVSHHLKGK